MVSSNFGFGPLHAKLSRRQQVNLARATDRLQGKRFRAAPKASSSWPNSLVASLTSDDIQYEQQFKKVEKACLDDVQNEKMHHHICFVLLGRTAVGKSTTADNAFGPITLDQINLTGIETVISTYI